MTEEDSQLQTWAFIYTCTPHIYGYTYTNIYTHMHILHSYAHKRKTKLLWGIIPFLLKMSVFKMTKDYVCDKGEYFITKFNLYQSYKLVSFTSTFSCILILCFNCFTTPLPFLALLMSSLSPLPSPILPLLLSEPFKVN